jgi:hypothetical protein
MMKQEMKRVEVGDTGQYFQPKEHQGLRSNTTRWPATLWSAMMLAIVGLFLLS